MPATLVGTYRAQDIADAQHDLERLRRDCHQAFIKHGGNQVFLYVNGFSVPQKKDCVTTGRGGKG